MAKKLPQATYWLDAEDRIVEVSSDWGRFSEENGATNLNLDQIRGTPLRSFIVGDTTRAWVFAMLSLARLRRQPVENPYRCDSPEERRFMSMRVVPLDNDGLRVEHYLVRTEPAPARVACQYASSSSRRYRVRCSICNDILVGGKWLDLHLVDAEPNEGKGRLDVIYGVCPTCLARSPGRIAAAVTGRSGNS